MRKTLSIVMLILWAAAPVAWAQGISSFFEDKLAEAVKSGSAEDARAALLKGASPDSKSSDGDYFYLIEATRADFPSVVRVLLQFNANVNIRDQLGNSPLHWAAEGNKSEVARILIAGRADINAQDRNGLTPLMKATQANQSNMVEMLLREKADTTLTDFTGRTALDIAIRDRKTTIASMLRAAPKK